MNLETTAANLRSALALMNGVVERRNTIPVLGTVKIGDGKLTATNLDMEATVSIPTTGKAKGETAIDFYRLSALAKHIQPDEAVEIKDTDRLATIAFNGSAYTLPSIPVSDFPDFGDVSGERTATDNAGLVAAFRRVRFAISTEETRYYLNGIAFIENSDGVPHVAATDGHRLAYAPIPFMPDGAKGQILHKDLISYLCARKGEPKNITFHAGKPRARFEYDGLTVAAKLIDGTYPDIWRVISTDSVPYLTCDRARLLTILRRIEAFVHPFSKHGCAIKITGEAEKITLSVNHGDGCASETMAAQCNESFEVSYNIHYLIDVLSALTGDTVIFATSPGAVAGNPCSITAQHDALRIVLMPMRV